MFAKYLLIFFVSMVPLVELRVPFDLAREAIDDVERGAED